jgi:pilus assembly protein TadC
MAETADSGGMLQSIGEAVGGFLSGIPSAISSFFAGVGKGAGVHGMLDWAALIIGIALLISAIRGLKRGRIVGPMVSGAIAVGLMGWAVT